jgi:thioredoxin 1
MPVYDTPINTDAASLPRLLGAGLPVLLYLYETPSDVLDEVLREGAEDFAGDVLIVRVNTRENPQVHAEYGNLTLPALVTVDDGRIESEAANIRSEDVDDHLMFLMGQGPLPQDTAAERTASTDDEAAPFHTTDATFQQDVLASELPVLVDFWAPWCGPCHAIAPTLEKLAAEFAGTVRVAKLNVDENPVTAQSFGVRGIPTLLMFKDGEQVGQLVGALPQPAIQQLIEKAL